MRKAGSPSTLLTERASLIARVDEIDSLLREQHGIEMAAKVRKARPQRGALLAALADGPKDAAAIAALTGQTVHAVAQMAHLLHEEGAVERPERGVYALPKGKRIKCTGCDGEGYREGPTCTGCGLSFECCPKCGGSGEASSKPAKKGKAKG